jgi:hypothetical protein
VSVDLAVAPEEQEAVAVVHATVGQARAIEVHTPEEARGAVEFLAKIADAKKQSETARKFLVDPMNKHVKAINDRFKRNAVPLEEADQLVRGKLLEFAHAEGERVAKEQARLDEQRQAAEEAAEEERRRQAQEAARVEREAAEVERARQAQLRQAENERAREIAAMSDADLEQLAVRNSLDARDTALVTEEMSARLRAREATERAEESRRLAEEAQQREIAAKSAPAAVATTTQLASASGSASTRKRWTATVVDATRIPREYLAVDQKAINAAVKDGVRAIPGVRIEQVDGLAIRAGGGS